MVDDLVEALANGMAEELRERAQGLDRLAVLIELSGKVVKEGHADEAEKALRQIPAPVPDF